jgi:hypothetical protein
MNYIEMTEDEFNTIKEYVEQLEQNIAHLQEKCLLLETQKDIAKAKLNKLQAYTLGLEMSLNNNVINT